MPPKLDITKENLYDLLDLTIDSSQKDIVRAYRRKALKYHPDKNSDKSAVEIFHKLSQALEILADESARASYDRILKAREAAKVRHKQLDAKRQKLKEDLEARESAAQSNHVQRKTDERNLFAEIERLRTEGNSLLKHEQQLLQEQLDKEKLEDSDCNPARIRIKWKSSKEDSNNGGYTEFLLKQIFSQYSEVSHVLISRKKKGSAVLEFGKANNNLSSCDLETGLPENPLTVSWLSGKPDNSTNEPSPLSAAEVSTTQSSAHSQPSLEDNLDFENLVMRRMRQAEERKRIIEEIKRQDEVEENFVVNSKTS